MLDQIQLFQQRPKVSLVSVTLVHSMPFHNTFVIFTKFRFYWDRDMDDCVIRQTNTQFRYGYEYLGNSGRLVITPLTDRYILFSCCHVMSCHAHVKRKILDTLMSIWYFSTRGWRTDGRTYPIKDQRNQRHPRLVKKSHRLHLWNDCYLRCYVTLTTATYLLQLHL